jgi:glycosyltransferase involved in cell wall biosynthesis
MKDKVIWITNVVYHISSFSTTGCGVSKYTEELIQELNRLGFESVPFKITAKEIWKSFSELAKFLRITIGISKPLIHIQYTPPTTGPFMFIILLLSRIKNGHVIITAHEKSTGYLRHFKGGIMRSVFLRYEAMVYKLSSKIFVHSREHKRHIITQHDIEENKIEVIAHGICMNNPPHPSSKTKGDPSTRRITFFGSLRPNKGVEVLIRAYNRLVEDGIENIELIIAGGSPVGDQKYEVELKRLVDDLNLDSRVRFLGFISERDIEPLMTSTDIIALPYLEITQSGVMFRQVLPYNIPLIATDVGGLGEIVKDYELGLVSKPGDDIALANNILALIDDEELRERFRKNQVRAVKELSWSRVAEKYARSYHELMDI